MVWWLGVLFGVLSALINLPIVEKPVARCRGARSPACPSAMLAIVDACGAGRPAAAGDRRGDFKAIVIEKTDGGQKVALTDFDEADLMDGDVTVRVEWSTLNYKDGLAITGKAPVVRRFPMIAGIDFAGTVETSSHPDWKPGDQVILNGWGLRRDPSRRLCARRRA